MVGIRAQVEAAVETWKTWTWGGLLVRWLEGAIVGGINTLGYALCGAKWRTFSSIVIMSDNSEEEVQVEMIPNDPPGAERKGSFKRRKNAVNKLTLQLKKLK